MRKEYLQVGFIVLVFWLVTYLLTYLFQVSQILPYAPILLNTWFMLILAMVLLAVGLSYPDRAS